MDTFSEKQRFAQWWVWMLLSFCSIMFLVPIFRSLMAPQDNSTLQLVIFTALIIAIWSFFIAAKLHVNISKTGIDYQLFPLHLKKKHINWAEVETAEVVTYNAITEYGGWGLRFSLNGKKNAVTTSGNQGLQLLLKNGKTLLIGTKEPEKIASFISKNQL